MAFTRTSTLGRKYFCNKNKYSFFFLLVSPSPQNEINGGMYMHFLVAQRLPTTSYQLVATNYQLVSYLTNYQLPASQLATTSYQLPTASYQKCDTPVFSATSQLPGPKNEINRRKKNPTNTMEMSFFFTDTW